MFVFDAVLAVSNDGERIARYFEGGQLVRVKRAAPKRAAVLNNGVLYFGVAWMGSAVLAARSVMMLASMGSAVNRVDNC
uniref:CPSF_A domain-containing protein n=1 Tax=Globodera pallida TaxID=36090 RepID=A0A183BSP5_GLOPA